jgi:hypothetical protein
MKSRLFILLIAIIAIGNYGKGQDLVPKEGVNGKLGLVNNTGKEIVPCDYDYIGEFSNGLAPVMQNGKYGYVKMKTGQEIIPCDYDYIGEFSNGLVPVMRNGKYGYVKMKTGQEIIPCDYDYIGEFFNGLVSVKLNEKSFYIDKTGKCIKDCP